MAVGNGICFGTGPPAGGVDAVATGVAVDVAGVAASGSAVAVAGSGTRPRAGNREQAAPRAPPRRPSHDPVLPDSADRKSEPNPAFYRRAHKPK